MLDRILIIGLDALVFCL